MDWTDLDPDERLTYLIGDIVRSDVFLEWEARGVFRVVSQVSARPPEREHRDLAPLLGSIKDSLRGLVVDKFATEMARHAVIEAAAAHKQRSGPVHDYWMHQGGADERWVSVQSIQRAPAVEATARNIEAFVRCRDAILHAAWRMRAVGLILPMWLGLPSSVEYLGDDEIRWWTAAAHGLFRTPSGPGLLDVEKNHALPLPPRRDRDRRRDRLDTGPLSGNS